MKRDGEPLLTDQSMHFWRWATVLVVVVILLALCFHALPPPPVNWSKVTVGMTEEDVSKLVPGIVVSSEAFRSPMGSIGHLQSGDEARWWEMTVGFDNDNRVYMVMTHYQYKPWRWLPYPLINVERSSG